MSCLEIIEKLKFKGVEFDTFKIEHLSIYLEKEFQIELDTKNMDSELQNIDYIYDSQENELLICTKII